MHDTLDKNKSQLKPIYNRSRELFASGGTILPDGVSSPVRTFQCVDSPPIVAKSGRGVHLVDEDNNRYIDFVMGLGSLILGHAPPSVVTALHDRIQHGTVFCVPTEIEYKLARKIKESSPCIDKLRFVCSGTEGVMSALRLAKAFTQRQMLLKFVGSYHGHADPLFGRGSNFLNAAQQSGIDPQIHKNTLLAKYNDPQAVREIFQQYGNEIAAIVVEPVASNMGLALPHRDFLACLREMCDRWGALLIFDEVVTGFRFCYGSVSNDLGVRPDLVVFGKIIGGGTPIGAYGGREDIMNVLQTLPLGSNVTDEDLDKQGGTFAGNPLSMTAGLAVLNRLSQDDFYPLMESLGQTLETALKDIFQQKNLPFGCVRKGSLLSVLLMDGPLKLENCDDFERQNFELFARFHFEMLKRHYFLPNSIAEPWFISFAHQDISLPEFARNVGEALALCLNS
ncbi:MAG: glutamate-1-semialdehyde 2,1-aminomutase [Cyanobacteria bacterium SBLK]|nr:glutamate-1-semialdehyde 2,1-aminomutase [Cyanobacteria bacterium SBLK]